MRRLPADPLPCCCVCLLALSCLACSSGDDADPQTDGDILPDSDGDDEPDMDGDDTSDGDNDAVSFVPRDPPPFANPLADEPYLQEFNHTSNEVEAGLETLISVLFVPSSFTGFDEPTQVVPRGVVRHTDTSGYEVLSIPESDTDLLAATTNGDMVFLANGTTVYTLNADGVVQTLAPLPDGCLTPVLAGGTTNAYLACESGLFLLSPTNLNAVAFETRPITAVTEYENSLFVGGQGFVANYALSDLAEATTEAHFALGVSDGLPDAAVRAILNDVTLPQALNLVLVTDLGVFGATTNENTATLTPNIDAFAENRVPLMPVRGAAKTGDGGFVLFSADGGACRILERGHGPEWRMYNAERWLPSENVRAVVTRADRDDASLWFATAGGLASVTARTMTLEEKMEGFDERLALRHDRDGAVADSRLSIKGDLSTSIPWDSDNDGGWTCYQVLAQCYRYKVTGDELAKQRFDKALNAMLNLHDLTGSDYFLARSVIRKEGCRLDDCDNPDDGEWFTSPDGEWWVKADTSNDEVTSHMFMMGPAFDLCADDTQKERIRRHVGDIVGGIVDHGYLLWDLDGLPTTFGQWDPAYVNDDLQGQFGDGGRRSAQMIAMLNLAYYLTGESRFLEAKADLLENHHYGGKHSHRSGLSFP